MFNNVIFKYYGVDWLGALLMIVFLVSIGSKKQQGFLFGMAGNIAWFIFSIQTESVASIAVCSIQFFLNLRAYYMWNKSNSIPKIYIDKDKKITVQALQKVQWHQSISRN